MRRDGGGTDLVQHLSGLAQQGFGGVQFDFQFANVGDHVEVIAGPVDLGIDPWPGLFANEADGVIDGFVGNADIDGGLDQL
ncbi:hypothetical protein D3C76_1291640 [compost metagenome]